MPNNTTTTTVEALNESYIVSNGRLVEVGQGPRPLAELLYSPPPWLPGVLGLLAVLAFAGVCWGLWRRGISREVAEEMLWNISILVGVGLAASILPGLVDWPYLWDFAAVTVVGIGGGWLLAWLLIHHIDALERLDRGATASGKP